MIDRDQLAALMIIQKRLSDAAARARRLASAVGHARAMLIDADPAITSVARLSLSGVEHGVDFNTLADELIKRRNAAASLIDDLLPSPIVEVGPAEQAAVRRAEVELRAVIEEFDALVAGGDGQ
jgi:hypothetical protein